MLRNYLAAAWRSACHDRLYALLNVLGLALAFTVVTLIGLFLRDELSYNTFLPGYADIYRVQLTIGGDGEPPTTSRLTPTRLVSELQLDFPEIIATTRDARQTVGLRAGNVEAAESIEWVDPNFLTVLGFKLLAGDPATALAQPDTIVLTRSLAHKYFGTLDCLGQTIELNHLRPMRVTGIAEDTPSNATLRFVALASGKTAIGKLASLDATPAIPGELSVTVSAWAQLRAGVDAESLTARLDGFSRARYGTTAGADPLFKRLYLNSLAREHLHPNNPDTSEPEDRIETFYAVSATGLLILLLAGVNFVNLTTARATRRAVEVGVRKGLGALRSQLMLQFMGEALGYSIAGMALGMVLAAVLLPRLNAFLDRSIVFDIWQQPALILMPLTIAILLGLTAGFYPAVILSRLPPAMVLKSRAGTALGGARLRQALVVFQFTVTIALLIATTVIHRQISFANAQALNFDKNLVLTIDLTGMPDQITPDGLGRREAAPVEALRTQLASIPGVKSIAATFVVPLLAQFYTMDFARADRSDLPSVSASIQPVDFGYFGLYHVKLLAGRDFAREFAEDKMNAEDKSRLSGVIINETARRALGFADAAAAIGRELEGIDPGFSRHHRIIGVAPDFPLGSIRSPVPPNVFIVDPDLFNVLSVKLSGNNLTQTLAAIDSTWREFVPDRPINRVFLDDRIAALYTDVTRQGELFAAFAGFAVVIGCLGLIGLSAYTAERRTQEIGIRKALGASTFGVALLMIRQFIQPVLLANLLAWPIAWWLMRNWLDGFAYRIDLELAPFLAAGLIATGIAILTTTFHAVQVARSRPVTALRYE
jgi:putative ABC transport system permease protein